MNCTPRPVESTLLSCCPCPSAVHRALWICHLFLLQSSQSKKQISCSQLLNFDPYWWSGFWGMKPWFTFYYLHLITNGLFNVPKSICCLKTAIFTLIDWVLQTVGTRRSSLLSIWKKPRYEANSIKLLVKLINGAAAWCSCLFYGEFLPFRTPPLNLLPFP